MNVSVASGVSVGHEDAELLSDFYAYAANNPRHNFVITSGDRTQQPASSIYPIAPEGSSLHERFAYGKGADEAIDVTKDGRALGTTESNAVLAIFGIHVPFSTDPVHTELLRYNA